jgi:hypothetical protein
VQLRFDLRAAGRMVEQQRALERVGDEGHAS